MYPNNILVFRNSQLKMPMNRLLKPENSHIHNTDPKCANAYQETNYLPTAIHHTEEQSLINTYIP